MGESIHGHAVLNIILEAHEPLTRTKLAGIVGDLYGHDCEFHTCSTSGQTLDQLLDFVVARGKVAEVDGLLRADRERICSN